jgi:hypothetical protein
MTILHRPVTGVLSNDAKPTSPRRRKGERRRRGRPKNAFQRERSPEG